MHPLLDRLANARQVTFIVGYTKSTHDLPALKRTLREYQQRGFIMRVWPNYHAKLWIINEDIYCGSQNFTPSFGPNYMVRTRDEGAYDYVRRSYAISSNFSSTTKLELIPNHTMP